MEVMCRERAALAKKKWNSGWQKQRSGSSSGNLLTHSQKDASPRPRVIPDPTINWLHATAPRNGTERNAIIRRRNWLQSLFHVASCGPVQQVHR
jgi:hypothetical protein